MWGDVLVGILRSLSFVTLSSLLGGYPMKGGAIVGGSHSRGITALPVLVIFWRL